MAEHVGLHIMSKAGEAIAMFANNPVCDSRVKVLKARRAQFTAKPLEVARGIVLAKIAASGFDRNMTKALLARALTARTLEWLLGVEGEAGFYYWRMRKGFPLSFKDNVPPSWLTFMNRSVTSAGGRHGELSMKFKARNAVHPLNCLFNYALSIALNQVTRTIVGLGLCPTFGFLHVDKVGRLSFSYDVMELLRPRIDAILFGFAQERIFARADFEASDNGRLRLSNPLARELAVRVLHGLTFSDYVEATRKIMAMFIPTTRLIRN